ncbi:hypothetical protein [uncultured Hymenobacter sp.]|uniref:hypothetical protein n=1 Tax=uncultured Hymenobacter sp. TaxID=170016 RepID=UPI0035CB46F4
MAVKESQAQLDVWTWKEQAQKSLDHLPDMRAKLTLIHERTRQIVEELQQARRNKSSNDAPQSLE